MPWTTGNPSVLFVDVNVLIYAHRPESPDHVDYKDWLETARRAREPLGVADVVLSGFLRIVTNPKVFREPTPIGPVLEFVDQIRSSPSYLRATPSSHLWDIFGRLATMTNARGGAVPDAYLAASAIDLNATLVTADRGFARYKGLDWAHPLD